MDFVVKTLLSCNYAFLICSKSKVLGFQFVEPKPVVSILRTS